MSNMSDVSNIDTSRIRPGYAVHCHSKQEALQLKQAMNWNAGGSGNEAWKYLFPAAESRNGYLAVSFSTLLPRGTKIIEFEDLFAGSVDADSGLNLFNPQEPRTLAEFVGAERSGASELAGEPLAGPADFAFVVKGSPETGAPAGPELIAERSAAEAEVIQIDFSKAEAPVILEKPVLIAVRPEKTPAPLPEVMTEAPPVVEAEAPPAVEEKPAPPEVMAEAPPPVQEKPAPPEVRAEAPPPGEEKPAPPEVRVEAPPPVEEKPAPPEVMAEAPPPVEEKPAPPEVTAEAPPAPEKPVAAAEIGEGEGVEMADFVNDPPASDIAFVKKPEPQQQPVRQPQQPIVAAAAGEESLLARILGMPDEQEFTRWSEPQKVFRIHDGRREFREIDKTTWYPCSEDEALLSFMITPKESVLLQKFSEDSVNLAQASLKLGFVRVMRQNGLYLMHGDNTTSLQISDGLFPEIADANGLYLNIIAKF
ncbi:MAG: hypothetical protein LBK56_01210 [Gracilibacteraceae bacterium]|jgi:hypothetical protein|nr:hypothetical protein [Gracilibacteraceae bacterium]